ncbi:MAG: ABC transporter permease [Burkholderiaceae bacterium]
MMLASIWLQREWRNFVPAVLAVAFSCLMLALQAALVMGIFGSAAVYIHSSDADLWVGGPGTQSVNFGQPIGMNVESMLRVHPDVQAVEPYLWVDANWRGAPTPQAGAAVPVYVSGIEPTLQGLAFSRLLSADMRDRLNAPGAVIVDRADLEQLGTRVGERAWINDVAVDVVGAVAGLRALGGVNVIASMTTAREIDETDQGVRPTYLLVSLRVGADPITTRDALANQSGVGPYQVWTAEEFADQSERYWLLETGAGAAVLFMAAIVFIVGAVVTGQALVSVVARASREFAVLMALGVSRSALCRVVLVLAALIGLVGIVVGMLGTLLLFGLATWRDVPVGMNLSVAAVCAIAILGLSLCSGLFAMRGLVQAEPATLLR